VITKCRRRRAVPCRVALASVRLPACQPGRCPFFNFFALFMRMTGWAMTYNCGVRNGDGPCCLFIKQMHPVITVTCYCSLVSKLTLTGSTIIWPCRIKDCREEKKNKKNTIIDSCFFLAKRRYPSIRYDSSINKVDLRSRSIYL